MSATILRINTAINSRNARASPNPSNSRGSSDSDEMPALIFECDSGSDSETMPALVDYDSDSDFETMPALVDDDGEVVCIQRRTRPQELTGYSFSDFFAGALNIEDICDDCDTPDTTFIVYDGKTRGIKSLGEIFMLDAYHQKTNANANAILAI